MNTIDQGALEDAAEKLLACVDVARGEVEGVSVAEQVEATLVVLRDAREVLMTWRRRASGTAEKRPKDGE